MIQPYLALISAAGTAGILWHRHRILTHEISMQRAFEREQRRAVVAARGNNELRERLTLEEANQKLQEKLAQVNTFLRKAETHFARHEWRETEKYLVQALALDEHNPRVNNLLGLTYLHNGEWRRAEIMYRKLVGLEPREASHFGNLGLALYYLEDYAESRTAYETALKLDDKKASRWVSLGQVCLKLANPKSAVEAFTKAVKLERRNPDYLAALAESCEAAGRPERALRMYERALEITPYNEELKSRAEALKAAGVEALDDDGEREQITIS